MKLTLNYAILKYFTKVEKASVNEVMEALKGEFGKYKPFKKKSMIEALMTAKENGLIDEDSFELKDGELIVYYKASQEQKDTINAYIK
ncbi:hypothetical protein ACQRBF_03155 [Peptoniphilaceae bacterium SGI.131]